MHYHVHFFDEATMPEKRTEFFLADWKEKSNWVEQ
jgi:hypothetical protein